ncbi:MAG TPA: hypothetical protein VN718_01830, partial [Rhizomicrobium sp.]|nr:hypothetical protein [Rhizomicrobium sp.]
MGGIRQGAAEFRHFCDDLVPARALIVGDRADDGRAHNRRIGDAGDLAGLGRGLDAEAHRKGKRRGFADA